MRALVGNKSAIRGMNNKNNVDVEAAYQITVTRKEITKKPKRIRSAFTTEQVQFLEETYKKHPYIDNVLRKEFSKVLNITERSVKIWFQNRRMREKNDKDNDCKTLKITPNGRLSNSPTSTNSSQLPKILSTNVHTNEITIDKNKSINQPVNDTEKNATKLDLAKATVVNKTFFKTETAPNNSKIDAISNDLTFESSRACYIPQQAKYEHPIPRPKHCLYNSYPKHPVYHPAYMNPSIWRPVNMAPVVPNRHHPVVNTQMNRQVGSCCKCNCHSRNMVNFVPQSTLYPYPHYMYTAVPFQNDFSK